jgi:hypothetical protein
MDNDIETIYKKFNYPSNVQKLLKLVKAAGITATSNDIKTFLDKRVAIQQTKIIKKSKTNKGHIVSFKAFDLLEMDIFVLDKYSKQNKGYGYIFAVVDVFSRKAYAYPMKHKALENTTAALKRFFDESDVKKYKTGFSVIVSDSDSAFLGGKDQGETRDFQKVLDDNDCIHDTVPIGDHNALAIVDRWARTLKTILTKVFLENGNTKWSDELDTIVDNYNNTPHDTLDDHTPNEALTDEAVRIDVMHANMDKKKKNAQLQAKGSDISIGDHVRVSIANFFKKGTEPRWSDDIYTVEGVKGMTITLSDDKTYKRDKLLKIPKDTIKITDSSHAVKPNVIKQATKQHKQHLTLKAEDIKADNIQSTKRDRVANKQLNDFVLNKKAAVKAVKAVIAVPAAEKNKETVSNTRDRIANKQLHDFVLNNKKKETTTSKH